MARSSYIIQRDIGRVKEYISQKETFKSKLNKANDAGQKVLEIVNSVSGTITEANNNTNVDFSTLSGDKVESFKEDVWTIASYIGEASTQLQSAAGSIGSAMAEIGKKMQDTQEELDKLYKELDALEIELEAALKEEAAEAAKKNNNNDKPEER